MREFKQLKTKKGRNETGLFMIEGEKFVTEIPSHWEIVRYIMAHRFTNGKDLSNYTRAPVEIVRDSLFDTLADTVSPQGIIAIVRQKHWQLDDVIHPASQTSTDNNTNFILIGENLNDPGNIGTLIRTAAAAGARGAILTQGSGDFYNPKVQRAAAGAALRLPVVTNAPLTSTLTQLKQANYAIYAAHLNGEILPYDLDLSSQFCWLVGNESQGLTPEATAQADKQVRLPMASTVESLNASIAGGILLYEVVRQRHELKKSQTN